MLDIIKESTKQILLLYEVDIHSKYYKSSDNYVKIKNAVRIGYKGSFMSLEEFIERYLLSEKEVQETYENIYDMGNPYKLNEKECEDESVAKELITLIGQVTENNIEAEVSDLLLKLRRKGGLINRLNTYLNIDLENFPKKDLQYKKERCKILFFFFMLENDHFKGTNILELLSNPSMENIDNSADIQTRNGIIINTIKTSLEKELSLEIKNKIRESVKHISFQWDEILENASYLMDFLYENGYEYDFESTIEILTSDHKDIEPKDIPYPMESLYLKIVQHEYIGNVKDIIKINAILKDYAHSISPELIEEMRQLNYCPIDIDDIENYIEENAPRLAKYVYLETKTSSYDVQKIRNAKGKFCKWISFCRRAKPLLNIKTILNELQLVSFLQAVILDDKNETFDYTFYGYQKYSKHMKRVQAALKNDDYVPNALQCYWVRKVTDRWYANLGRSEIRIRTRKFEQVCDHIREEILSTSNLDEMYQTHNFYLEKLDDGLITTHEQIQAAQQLKRYLYSKGFDYLDDLYVIRYAFLFPPEIEGTYESLKLLINNAIQAHDTNLEITFEAHSADGKNDLDIKFSLNFDYNKGQCIMQNFELVPIQ